MTGMSAIAAIVAALDLPPRARVDTRVPKKMLVEQGAPTTADKRAIQDGVDEIHWLAALKPNTTAIPAFTDEVHDYSEIAVIAATFRSGARATRLTELIHRAIPYPVLLISTGPGGVAVSVAPKRAAQNESGKNVLERVAVAGGLDPLESHDIVRAFLTSLALKSQPARNLSTVYDGWNTRIEAYNAGCLTGGYAVADNVKSVAARRAALDAHARLTKEIKSLRAKAKREQQLGRRVELNMEIQRREADLVENAKWL